MHNDTAMLRLKKKFPPVFPTKTDTAIQLAMIAFTGDMNKGRLI
jgi:hypothetical protein